MDWLLGPSVGINGSYSPFQTQHTVASFSYPKVDNEIGSEASSLFIDKFICHIIGNR